MSDTERRVYSAQRLRIVVVLLTLVFLPIVIGTSALIYEYVRFSVLVEQRLRGEKGRLPSRVYARPLVLRPGIVLTPDDLVKVLNGLRYGQRPSLPSDPGQFSVSASGVAFFPRPVESGARETLLATFSKDKQGVTRIKDLRAAAGKKRYEEQALEPELVTYLFEEEREKRRRVALEELPDHLVKAVLAIEDRRFFSHPGLDPLRLVAAAVRNLRTESAIPHGGSTITQQLCKNFFLTHTDERGYRSAERSYRRKVQEALLAFVIERRATKRDILELYLNDVYLGQAGSFGITGVGEAARIYFRKDVANLTLPESALLAGMIQSPNPYNPFRHEKRATERRNEVIRAMQDAGFIDAKAMEAALAAPLLVGQPSVDTTDAPYFVDLVRRQLGQRYDSRDLTTQNLSIYTTLDLHLQGLAQQALERGLDRVQDMIKSRTTVPVQGSLIAIEPASGKVVALLGGRSYGRSQYNRVVEARRQPGSTFKPFVYLTAFEATYDDPSLPPITPATVVEDAPSVFFFEDKEYIPTNYEETYHGLVTLRRALAMSMNVATVKVAEMVGYDKVADMWSKKLGIGAPIHPYPAVALGAFEATPLEMATAYNVLANDGLKVEPVTILQVADEKDRVLEQHQAAVPERVVREESAFLVRDMLRSVLDEGTGASARGLGFTAEAAGKTGTTNDYRDAWFAGFTPDLLCVVWVGFDDNTPVGLSGTKAALPIWVDFMKAALGGHEPARFPDPPEGIVFVEIDAETGLLARPACPKKRMEAFVAGTEPREPCGAHR
ncbi:MAG TPA: PBP1A family penicillin-binding protein [Vicinamibacteria bacterium]|nr:PBP1A family penicillin-binding protein [Vicinamibacteria bacterium]